MEKMSSFSGGDRNQNLVCGSVAEGAASASEGVTETKTKKTCIVTGSSSGTRQYSVVLENIILSVLLIV